jgi:O-antigen ligase
VLLAIFFCDSFIAILAAILTILFILYFKNKKFFTILLVLLIILSGVFAGILVKGHLLKIREGIAFRLSSYLGTFHGIRYNPILGWGIGTFEPIIAMVKIEKSAYFMGRSFNTGSAVLNHPHNELLYGWWNIGILFPILIIALFIKKLKSFNENNLLTSAIIFCGFIIMNGCFLNPPLWILLMFALGIHDNQLEVKNGKCSEGEASG